MYRHKVIQHRNERNQIISIFTETFDENENYEVATEIEN